ncbi:hypothetical protein PIB30_086851 [Stylosanthes scabra]|uniref:Uncharacterized protein n=1 Tax=Stylosanthes scabra TaxID=79078 RepID=A0ABU6RTL5_9FABA|nr:hypothetical protein [Stylosanthes scabra]
MMREFYSNFSADHQTHVFLQGRRIPFSEDDIRRFLGINIDLPPPGEDNMYKMRVAARKNGGLDMDLVYQVIGRPWNNWANNPTDNILNIKIDNAILNAQATAWHKLIIANIDPKQCTGARYVREQDMYFPYRCCGRLILPPPAPPVQRAEQCLPSPPPQPAAFEIPSSSIRRPPESSLREVMRYLRRQERLQLNTQSML